MEFGIFIIFMFFLHVHSQLIVNVKSHSGEILQETFATNTSDDSVTLEFFLKDGSLITNVLDFKQDLQIFRVISLGEEELGEPPFQVMCFITRFNRGDYIDSDAMSKLRQKNPDAIRTPEGDQGSEYYDMNLSIDIERASFLSSHIPSICKKASSSTYASERDLKLWASLKQDIDWDWIVVREATHRVPIKGVRRCEDLHRETAPASCLCRQQVCLSWYPCGLKYCKGRDNLGKNVSYRCGIRTCKRCSHFTFFVPHRSACLPTSQY